MAVDCGSGGYAVAGCEFAGSVRGRTHCTLGLPGGAGACSERADGCWTAGVRAEESGVCA